MGFNLTDLQPTGLDREFVELLIDEHSQEIIPRLERMWDYYRNDLVDNQVPGVVGRWYQAAQEVGLPARLRNSSGANGSVFHGQPQREIVIENDIAWRIHTLVDFTFGRPAALQSCAADPERARLIESFLREVFEVNGGVGFYQDLALLGSVYGYVDVLLRVSPTTSRGSHLDVGETTEAQLIRDAGRFVLETIEAPRAIPVLDSRDYRRLEAYMVHYRQMLNNVEEAGVLSRVRRGVLGGAVGEKQRSQVECTEVWTDQVVLSFQGTAQERKLVDQSVNRLGRIPVVHIQNLPQPFFYEGLSEVEPLIPLQDELNTRLSDRANRVTFQSFKMYLGKGIEQFTDRPVGPGQMWATDSPDASIEEFGGDSESPSEDAHVNEIREAMDKTSGVTPVAVGLLRGRVGNLTSENALRITLMGLLSKTERRRVTYGLGIQRLSELILHAADIYGVLPNRPEERGVRLDWPSPLPENLMGRLREAQLKLEIGVSQKQVLTELGYEGCAES